MAIRVYRSCVSCTRRFESETSSRSVCPKCTATNKANRASDIRVNRDLYWIGGDLQWKQFTWGHIS